MKRWAVWILALCLALPGAGCTWRETKQNLSDTKNFVFDTGATTKKLYAEDDTPIIELNYDAADLLAKPLKKSLPPDSPISFERLTNEADPSDKSPFGRVVAGQLAARLAQQGLKVSTTAPRPAAPRPALDQNATDPKVEPPRPCLLSGSYVLAGSVILLHARVVAVDDDTELAGQDWTLPINKTTRELLPQIKGGVANPSVKTAF